MSSQRITYDREDILRLRDFKSPEFEIIDWNILDSISKTHNGLYNRKTKRGCRAGRRYKPSNNVPLVQQKRSKVPYLPTLLYTNCRSLNHWKLEEPSVYAEIHKPDVIFLTETWLDKNKESARQIVNYYNHFSHRKRRLGGGVAILTSNVISCKELCSHTTSTINRLFGSK